MIFNTKKTLDKWDSLSGKNSFKSPLSKESQEFWARIGGIAADFGLYPPNFSEKNERKTSVKKPKKGDILSEFAYNTIK